MAGPTVKKRKTKSKPNPNAGRWHEGLAETRNSIIASKELIINFSHYATILRREDFQKELTEEERTVLTESINVVRVAAGALYGVVSPVSAAVEKEAARPHAERNHKVFVALDADLVDATLAFDNNAIQSGHLDKVREIIEGVTARLTEKSEENV